MNANALPQEQVIETPRLRLRPHRIDDLDPRAAMTADPHVMRFFPATESREDNWARILRNRGHWQLLGWGLFAVEEKASGRFVGEVGLADFHRGLGSDFDGFPEGAWMLAWWAAGQGFAREAVAAAIRWHEGAFGAMRQVCLIAPDNAPSLRLAATLGFRRFAERAYRERTLILHERLPTADSDKAI